VSVTRGSAAAASASSALRSAATRKTLISRLWPDRAAPCRD
jgi:hypothetical protein